jgi:hypothetical protein
MISEEILVHKILQPVQDIQQFNLTLSQYKRISTLGWLFVLALILLAGGSIVLGILLWGTYTHNFTLYLKWQDALLLLSWFIALMASGGIVLAVRFLYALRKGYTRGMITLVGNTISVRDLSPENLKSILWVMNTAFWCFSVALTGLFPGVLAGWTLHLPSPLLVVIATAIAVILGLAGLIISIVTLSVIVLGCIGCVSFCRQLGSAHTYELNGQTKLSIDDFVLTIIRPDRPEAMIDLHLLSEEDQTRLLLLLPQDQHKQSHTSVGIVPHASGASPQAGLVPAPSSADPGAAVGARRGKAPLPTTEHQRQ